MSPPYSGHDTVDIQNILKITFKYTIRCVKKGCCRNFSKIDEYFDRVIRQNR